MHSVSSLVPFVCAGFWIVIPVQAQNPYRNSHDPRYGWELQELNERPALPANVASGPAIVSADELRHPLTAKARRAMEDANREAESGNHSAAIEDLRKAVVKYPVSAPYAYNLLGREYIDSGEYVKAEESFEEATRLMPHDSAHHSNLGLSLVILGQWDRAEQELRKALQLDRANAKAKQILEELKAWRSKKSAASKAAP
ncbi:MAG TPA: tetratricopeptide repeat protein [Bryobacteraceae bacterium]|jgi:Flp pilus assembly protein TadD|nr:tetratricopeptide repeat protein [Bryobacteraceae bacterium]